MKFLSSLAGLFKQPDSTSPASSTDLAVDPLISLFDHVLKEQGFEPAVAQDHLRLPSGLELRIEFIESSELENGRTRTMTRTVASHPVHFPNGLVEFQHSSGESTGGSVREGLARWIGMDLVTIEDAMRDKPDHCTFMETPIHAGAQDDGRRRRIIFGPTAHLVSPDAVQQDQDHPFCPCCLVTENFDAFRSLWESDETIGIRLFAIKHPDGQVAADCRVNGEEFPDGEKQLTEYALSWPATSSMEYRKQYVVMRTVVNPAPE